MKKSNLVALLNLIISFELMVTPLVANAQATKEKGTSTAETIGTILNVTGSLYNQITGRGGQQGMGQVQQDPNFMSNTSLLRAQQVPEPDSIFKAEVLEKMPGLGDYLRLKKLNPNALGCSTLKTTLNEVKSTYCDANSTPNPDINQIDSYFNEYSQISKIYDNYKSESNVGGQAFGIGCMKNAQQLLKGFFENRTSELDALTTKIEGLAAKFKEASRADLDAIEDATAVLDGGDNELVNKVKSRRPDLFDFAKNAQGLGDPACTSIQSINDLNNKGLSKGLNGIAKDLRNKFSERSGVYSAESFNKSASGVTNDILNVINGVADQSKMNFSDISKNYGATVGPKLSVSSSTKVDSIIKLDLLAGSQVTFQKEINKLKSQEADIMSELRAGSTSNSVSKVNDLLTNFNGGNFESEVLSIQNSIKNTCIQRSLGGNLNSMLDRIYDPSSSSFANKNASNPLKKKLKQILENTQTSPEKKLEDLKVLDNSNDQRYYVRLDSAYDVQDVNDKGELTTKQIPPTQPRTPSLFFTDVVNNCNAQFKANKLNNKYPGVVAIQKLRDLRASYEALSETNAKNIKSELTKKLIDCSSPDIANNTAEGSCTPALFNPSTSGFCVAAAKKCSSSMKACTELAEKYLADTKGQRTARVNNYKALVANNQKEIANAFAETLARFTAEGNAFSGIPELGAAFSTPNAFDYTVDDDKKYLPFFKNNTGSSQIDGKLILEDPDAYIAMFRDNIKKLKANVDEQQRGMVARIAEHINLTKANYTKTQQAAQVYADQCNGSKKAYNQQMNQMNAEMMKKNMELGEKRQEFCRIYSMAQENPGPACKGNITDLMKAASAMDGGVSSKRLAKVCDSFNNSSDSSFIRRALNYCPVSLKSEVGKLSEDQQKQFDALDIQIKKAEEILVKAQATQAEAKKSGGKYSEADARKQKRALEDAKTQNREAQEEYNKIKQDFDQLNNNPPKEIAEKNIALTQLKAKVKEASAKSAAEKIAADESAKEAEKDLNSTQTQYDKNLGLLRAKLEASNTALKAAKKLADQKSNDIDSLQQEKTFSDALENADKSVSEQTAALKKLKDAQEKIAPAPSGDEFTDACKNLFECQNEMVRTDDATGKIISTRKCTADAKETYATRVLQVKDPDSIKLDGDAPAFCTAGNNSMGNPKSMADIFSNTDRGAGNPLNGATGIKY